MTRTRPPHRSGPPSPRAVVRVRYGCAHAWPVAVPVTLAEIAAGRFHDCWLAAGHAGDHRCHCEATDPPFPEETP